MEIKFLKAGSGDCILIHNQSKNILIDGGNDSSYLIKEYDEIIKRSEKIDLLIVTHHDDDHIKGIIDLFEHIKKNHNDSPKIDVAIFNSPNKINNFFKEEISNNMLSYRQAYELENILFKYKDNIKWFTTLDKNIDNILEEKTGEVQLKIFSPSKEVLAKYVSNKGAYLSSDYRCDWKTSLKELLRFQDDDSQDHSESNKTSIVTYIIYKERKVLLTADVTPDRFLEIINQIKGDNDNAEFDLIKLPHHGSYKSISSKILQSILCKQFVISTNSSKYFLPNKRTIVKLIQNRKSEETLEFFFNYEEVVYKLNVTEKEKNENKIELNTNKNNWGYGITF